MKKDWHFYIYSVFGDDINTLLNLYQSLTNISIHFIVEIDKISNHNDMLLAESYLRVLFFKKKCG